MPYVFKASDEKDYSAYSPNYKCSKCKIHLVSKCYSLCNDCQTNELVKDIKRGLALLNFFYDNDQVVFALEEIGFNCQDLSSITNLHCLLGNKSFRLIVKFRKNNPRLKRFPICLVICFYKIKKQNIALKEQQMDELITKCIDLERFIL